VVLMFLSRQYTFGSNAVGIAALRTGAAKCDLTFLQAIALGILCNGLVCLAVWLSYSARSTIDKIFAIIFPITAFVAAGFEHSIANMYFIPYALFIKVFDAPFMGAVADKIPQLEKLTWQAFLINNLLPVTIGNILGGTVLVASVYWMVFLRPAKS
jgi:formate/nitrite transporter